MVRLKYLFWRDSSYKRTEKISLTWHYPLLRESVSVFSICSPRHKGRNFLAAIFIDFSAIEMKVLQGHCHLLLAYGFSSHVNYFATFHFNSLLSLAKWSFDFSLWRYSLITQLTVSFVYKSIVPLGFIFSLFITTWRFLFTFLSIFFVLENVKEYKHPNKGQKYVLNSRVAVQKDSRALEPSSVTFYPPGNSKNIIPLT